MLQQGVAVNPVAVYLPLSDLYARSARVVCTWTWRPRAGSTPGCSLSLRVSGYDFDVIHDHALATLSRIDGRELVAGTARYSVLIVPPTRLLPPESAARFLELARAGGHLIFVERVPEGAPGLRDREARDARVRTILEELRGGGQPALGAVVAVGQGTVAFVADSAAARKRLDDVLAPDFRIVESGSGDAEAARASVGFVHRRHGAADAYFVANVSAETRDLRVRFALGHRSPERWDPETGQAESPLVYAYVASGGRRATEVELRLEPFEACFVAFGAEHEQPLLTRTGWPGRLRVTESRGQRQGERPRPGER